MSFMWSSSFSRLLSCAGVTEADDIIYGSHWIMVTHTVVRHGESQDDVTGDVSYWLFKNESLGQYLIGL